MPRKLRVQYPGALYQVMSRGDRREAIFLDDVDRQDFLKTMAEACQKTDWQVHAYGLLRNHYLPEAELAALPKSDPLKLAIATRLRKETTVSLKAIAKRVQLGTAKGANTNLHKWMRAQAPQSQDTAKTHPDL